MVFSISSAVERHIGLFADRHHDTDHIALLKGISGNHARCNLPGNRDDRHGIHVGIGNPGHQVHGPRPGSRHADPDLRVVFESEARDKPWAMNVAPCSWRGMNK